MDVHQLESVVLFDSHVIPCIPVECLPDHCIGTFAYLFAKVVCSDVRTAGGSKFVSPGPVLILNVMGGLRSHFLGVRQCLVVMAPPLHHLMLLLVVYLIVIVHGILPLQQLLLIVAEGLPVLLNFSCKRVFFAARMVRPICGAPSHRCGHVFLHALLLHVLRN
jgi:hypothetical protein